MPDPNPNHQPNIVVEGKNEKRRRWKEAEEYNLPYIAVENSQDDAVPVYDMTTCNYRLSDQAANRIEEIFLEWTRQCTSEHVVAAGNVRGNLVAIDYRNGVKVGEIMANIVMDEENWFTPSHLNNGPWDTRP